MYNLPASDISGAEFTTALPSAFSFWMASFYALMKLMKELSFVMSYKCPLSFRMRFNPYLNDCKLLSEYFKLQSSCSSSAFVKAIFLAPNQTLARNLSNSGSSYNEYSVFTQPHSSRREYGDFELVFEYELVF